MLRHRWQPDNPEVKKIRDRDRSLHMSIDARLQWRAAELLEDQLRKLGRTKGAVVILDPATGDLLASVSYPWPNPAPSVISPDASDDSLLDRARYGLYPPGSSFKIVTSIAALRKSPQSVNNKYECKRLPDGRTGNFIKGWQHPIHDDIKDTVPHGNISMHAGLVVSCNAYFAQLGTYAVGAEALLDTANHLGISVANPSTVQTLQRQLAAGFLWPGTGRCEPFSDGACGGNHRAKRIHALRPLGDRSEQSPSAGARLHPGAGTFLPDCDAMRDVVTSGTGRAANTPDLPIAGKTGTAELEHAQSHAWFIGFAPYRGPRKLAFAVLIENGQYGGTAAAPLAAALMKEAKSMGYFEGPQ